jgi:hypothetical protein
MACRECNELLNPAVEKSIITDEQRPMLKDDGSRRRDRLGSILELN